VDGQLRWRHVTTDDILFPVGANTIGRAFASITIERPYTHGRLVLTTAGGAVGANGPVPAQDLLYFGGPVSQPGYQFHELATLTGVSQRVEWRTPIPAPSISLGRFGRIPGQATIVPFAQATFARPASPTAENPTGVYPAVGLALQPFFDLLRFQVARGMRHGEWTFNVDFSRDFWRLL